MSKILDATCSPLGVVTSESTPVVSAQVLSEGKQISTGLLFIEGDKARYLTSNATDIKTSLEKTVDALEDICTALSQIATTLTSIGAGMTGATTAPPPTLATDVTAINTKVTEITATKVLLNTLKGALK